MRVNFILYVRDQFASERFYREVFGSAPTLSVPGMSEFTLTESATLGLMPEAGICRLLGDGIVDPSLAAGIPRAELYVVVDGPGEFHERALAAGATELSALALRSWGHRAAYSRDPDGHILVFAEVADALSG